MSEELMEIPPRLYDQIAQWIQSVYVEEQIEIYDVEVTDVTYWPIHGIHKAYYRYVRANDTTGRDWIEFTCNVHEDSLNNFEEIRSDRVGNNN